MADTINTNSFFNQPEEGGGTSSVQALAQNAFDIATNIRTQFRDFVQTFDKYKLDAGESDRLINNTVSNLDIETDEINNTLKELQKNYESLEDDIRGQDKKITDIEAKVDEVSEVFYKFEQSQKAAAEKTADDAFRAQDAAQKAGDKEDGGVTAAGLGGLGGMFGGGDKGSGGGDDKEKKKGKGFWTNPWMLGMMGAGALHGMGAGINRGIGGAADFLTGGLFDFDGQSGGGGLRKIGGGLKNMFGGSGKDKPKGSSSGILGTISSDPKDMVNMPEDTKEESVETEVDDLESRVNALESGDPPPKDSKKTSQKKTSKLSKEFKFGKNTYDLSKPLGGLSQEEYDALGNKEREMLRKRLQFYADQNSEQRNDDIKNNETSPKEGTDEKGLEPISEEGEKKEKGLFGGFFSGLSGKKKDDQTSEENVKKTSKLSKEFKFGKNTYDLSKPLGGLSRKEFEALGDRESNMLLRRLGTYADQNPEERHDAIKNNETSPKEGSDINAEETTTEKGLEPTGKKGEGGGFKRAAGGFADFATGGMFDFDKKNRKGAPKDFGIRRMAGGVTDAMTMGLTDFDKRGSDNLQFGPIGGGKDKAWGSRNEQAKRGEKQSGMGIKRGIGGALDFATLGTFDFDKQNRKGSPKGWGIKRVAGGLADAITAGATDFDKRGTGIGQMKLGENMRRKKEKQKSIEAYNNNPAVIRMRKNEQSIKNPFGNTSITGLDGTTLKQGDPGFEEALLNARKMVQSVPSGSGANFNQLSQPPEGDDMPEVLPIQTAAGDNTSSNIINQMASDGYY